MSDVSSQPQSTALRIDVIAHLIGAFAVGSVVLSAAFMVSQATPAVYPTPSALDMADLMPALIVLVAVGMALVRPLRRFSWLIAAAGLFGVAALFLQGDALQRDQLFALLALSTGIQFAGVLLAFADAGRTARWAIALGFGAGAVAGRYALSLLVRTVRESVFSGTLHGDDAIVALLGVLAAGAGLMLLVSPRLAADAATAKPAAAWGPVVWVAAAALATVLLSRVWQLVLNHVAQSSTGGISQHTAEVVETMDLLARATIGAVVGVILLVAAYRRGGPNLARWVAVSFGLAATSVAIPTVLSTPASGVGPVSEMDLVVQGSIPAAMGAVAGAAAVRFADRRFPWDALGIVLGTAAVFVTSNRGRIDLPDLAAPAMALGSFGLGLALVAGLARLADPNGRGLSANDVCLSAGFGVAALVLCQQVISPVTYVVTQDVLSPQRTIPLTMLGAAVVLIVLFGLGRQMNHTRKDLVAETPAGQG